jgi:hypothetical protein
MSDYFLAHYGVRGMRWGVRLGRGGSKKPRPITRDAREYNRIHKKGKKHGVSSLSNRELTLYNRRTQLLRERKKNNPSGYRRVNESLKSVNQIGTSSIAIIALGLKAKKVAPHVRAYVVERLSRIE